MDVGSYLGTALLALVLSTVLGAVAGIVAGSDSGQEAFARLGRALREFRSAVMTELHKLIPGRNNGSHDHHFLERVDPLRPYTELRVDRETPFGSCYKTIEIDEPLHDVVELMEKVSFSDIRRMTEHENVIFGLYEERWIEERTRNRRNRERDQQLRQDRASDAGHGIAPFPDHRTTWERLQWARIQMQVVSAHDEVIYGGILGGGMSSGVTTLGDLLREYRSDDWKDPADIARLNVGCRTCGHEDHEEGCPDRGKPHHHTHPAPGHDGRGIG